MNVRIEIHVGGEVLAKWTPQDFELEVAPFHKSADFEERATLSEQFTQRFIDVFTLRMEPMLKSISRYELFIVYESSSKDIPLFPHQMREFEDFIEKTKHKNKQAS